MNSIKQAIAIRELSTIVSDHAALVDGIRRPQVLEESYTGLGTTVVRSDAYPDGVPEGILVGEMEGVSVDEIRGELHLAAGKLEVLASL